MRYCGIAVRQMQYFHRPLWPDSVEKLAVKTEVLMRDWVERGSCHPFGCLTGF